MAVGKIPDEVQILLGQGDLAVTLMLNSLYQLVAVIIGSLALLLAGLIALSGMTPIALSFLAFLIGAALLKAPWFIAFELQRYTDIRFRLISKILEKTDYSSELKELRAFVTDVTIKRKIVGLDFKWILMFFSILLLFVVVYYAYMAFIAGNVNAFILCLVLLLIDSSLIYLGFKSKEPFMP